MPSCHRTSWTVISNPFHLFALRETLPSPQNTSQPRPEVGTPLPLSHDVSGPSGGSLVLPAASCVQTSFEVQVVLTVQTPDVCPPYPPCPSSEDVGTSAMMLLAAHVVPGA